MSSTQKSELLAKNPMQKGADPLICSVLLSTQILEDASMLSLFLCVLSQHTLVPKRGARREFNTEVQNNTFYLFTVKHKQLP